MSIVIVAEIGINHNGIFDLAIEMINKSKSAGASAVKFQKRNTEYLLLPGTELEIPTGNPLVIEFDKELNIINIKYLDQTRKKEIITNQ